MFNRIKDALSSISPGFRSQVENSFRYRSATPQERERLLKFAASTAPAVRTAPVLRYPTPARPVPVAKSFSGITIKALAQKLNAATVELAAAVGRYREKHPARPKLKGLSLTAAAIKPQIKSIAARTAEPPEFKLPAPPAGGFKSHSEVASFYGPLLSAAEARMATAERVGHVPQSITTLRPSIQRAWNLATAQVLAANRIKL